MDGLNKTTEELLTQAAESGLDTDFTGRQIITFREGGVQEGVEALRTSEVGVAHASDFAESAVEFDALGDAGMIVFDELGVALVAGDSPVLEMAANAAESSQDSAIVAVEPETFVYAEQHLESYLDGFAAAVDRIRADLLEDEEEAEGDEFAENTAALTWGLIATRVNRTQRSGRGIKVAILDTGFDFRHPDFAGRPIVQRSFIPNQSAQDGHGHGTHCTGTACGPRAPTGVPRYGVAYESSIFIGKVLSNSGGSVGGSVLAGMNWAVANRCAVISMSLGGRGGPFTYYTDAGQRALNAGCLIVAAAGNNSARPGVIAPTLAPANSPTIVSVAAIDERLRVASFSCGGKVEIAAPGVNVFSSLPMPRRYGTLSGTSMATPHVAGIAALLAQSNPALRGVRLRQALLRSRRRLPFPPRDVGVGLVQATVLPLLSPRIEEEQLVVMAT
jgi:subtilisin family serine protease